MLGTDRKVYAPVEFEVEDVGYNDSAGNYVRGITTEKYECEGTESYVGLMFMHFEKTLVSKGQKLVVGDCMGIAGNTGFSTGPHTHMSLYRLKERKNIPKNRLDKDAMTNQTFNPRSYWNGKYAFDQVVWIFTRDLTVGSRGEDVRSLQKYLNAQGFPVAGTGAGSVGQETDYFGALTKQALARFQKAKGINPPAGYFGPITRAHIAGG